MFEQIKIHYGLYKKFCNQIDNNEWFVDKLSFTSWAIDNEGNVFCITRDGKYKREELWVANGLAFFSNYDYHRHECQTIDVFGMFKLAAWIKATPLILKVRKHNFEFNIKRIKKWQEDKRNALNNIYKDNK
jgi:hypothetical protein